MMLLSRISGVTPRSNFMNIKSRFLKIATLASMLLSLMAFSALATAENNEHDHNQEVTELKLNNGNKWAIDSSLSLAMTNIRNAVHQDLDAIHTNKLAEKKYLALAKKINTEVAYMVENCQLEPAADAQLHIIIHNLMEGAAVMENKTNARSGAVKVIGAIENYVTYFDDPKFVPVKH